MAQSFFELLSGCDASEYCVSAMFSVFAVRCSAFPELLHYESHKHRRAVVHNKPDGRWYCCAARHRASQLATKRMLSTTPVRGVMHQVVSNYSYTHMNKFGASFTNQIDIIGIREGAYILSIIQAAPLSPELTILLQEKLNHYLQYILDGQLHEERPEAYNMPKTIELHLQHPASGVAAEFLSKVKPYIESEGIKFTLIHSTQSV